MLDVVDGSLVADAGHSENEEVEGSIDALLTVDAVDVGLCNGQQVEVCQYGFVLFLCRLLPLQCALNGDGQIVVVDVLAEGATERKPQNLSFLTAIFRFCTRGIRGLFIGVNSLIIRRMIVCNTLHSLLIVSFRRAVRFLRF